MWWALAILLVLSPAVLYAVLGVLVTVCRGRCPECGKKGLKRVNFIRATIVVDGQRASDSWAYYVCEKCNAAFKMHRGMCRRIRPEEIPPCADSPDDR